MTSKSSWINHLPLLPLYLLLFLQTRFDRKNPHFPLVGSTEPGWQLDWIPLCAVRSSSGCRLLATNTWNAVQTELGCLVWEPLTQWATSLSQNQSYESESQGLTLPQKEWIVPHGAGDVEEIKGLPLNRSPTVQTLHTKPMQPPDV